MTKKIEFNELRKETAPLFCEYAGQTQPQSAFVAIEKDGSVKADYSGEIGNSVPIDVWHNRTLRIPVSPYVKGSALADYLESEDFAKLVARVHAGHSVEWDGSNYVGSLTDDALEALEKIERDLDDLDKAEVWDPGEWMSESSMSEVWPEGKTLEEAAAALKAEANADGVTFSKDIEDALRQKAIWARENDKLPKYLEKFLD